MSNEPQRYIPLSNRSADFGMAEISNGDWVKYDDYNKLKNEINQFSSVIKLKWQPIETAPKDGTQLLLFCGDEWCGIMVGHYGELITWDDITGNEEVETCWQSGLEKYCPTHWMPLPEIPND